MNIINNSMSVEDLLQNIISRTGYTNILKVINNKLYFIENPKDSPNELSDRFKVIKAKNGLYMLYIHYPTHVILDHKKILNETKGWSNHSCIVCDALNENRFPHLYSIYKVIHHTPIN